MFQHVSRSATTNGWLRCYEQRPERYPFPTGRDTTRYFSHRRVFPTSFRLDDDSRSKETRTEDGDPSHWSDHDDSCSSPCKRWSSASFAASTGSFVIDAFSDRRTISSHRPANELVESFKMLFGEYRANTSSERLVDAAVFVRLAVS